MVARRSCEIVLLVNEDRDCVDVTGDALRARGLAVLLAPDADQALAVMRAGFKPDAILIDATAGAERMADFVGTMWGEPAWRALPVLCVAGATAREMLQVSPRHRVRRLPVPSCAAELGDLLETLCSETRADPDAADPADAP
jgi:DNA-binding NtrC family response regulator